jgi:hypothetical protein
MWPLSPRSDERWVPASTLYSCKSPEIAPENSAHENLHRSQYGFRNLLVELHISEAPSAVRTLAVATRKLLLSLAFEQFEYEYQNNELPMVLPNNLYIFIIV